MSTNCSGSAYAARLEQLRERRATIPFYDGVQQLDADALLGSWAGEPDLDDPRHGRVRGADAFREWVAEAKRWLADAQASTRAVDLIVTAPRTVEEVALDLTIEGERRELPVAVVAERTDRELLTAVRIYHSLWPLTGGHEVRAPLLQRDPELTMPDVIGEYQRALANGDLEASSPPTQTTPSFASPPAANTSTPARTSCGASTACSSQTAAASRSSTAR